MGCHNSGRQPELHAPLYRLSILYAQCSCLLFLLLLLLLLSSTMPGGSTLGLVPPSLLLLLSCCCRRVVDAWFCVPCVCVSCRCLLCPRCLAAWPLDSRRMALFEPEVGSGITRPKPVQTPPVTVPQVVPHGGSPRRDTRPSHGCFSYWVLSGHGG